MLKKRALTKFLRRPPLSVGNLFPAFFKSGRFLSQLLLVVVLLGIFLGLMTIRRPPALKAPLIAPASQTSKSLFSAKNSLYNVNLGERNTNKPAIDFAVATGESVSFSPANLTTKQSTPIVDQYSIIFSEVFPNVDFKYTTLPEGLKEEIIIKNQAYNHTFTFDLNTLKAFPWQESNSLYTPVFYDENGRYLFHFAKPFAIDAKGNRTDNITVQIKKDTKNNTFQMTLSVDRDWLESKDRVYPITIDPTIIHDEYTTSEFAVGQLNRVTNSGSVSVPFLESYFQELTTDKATVSLWHMNEASGNILDSSGNSNTGTVTGATVVTGKFGNARSFNGSSYYISVGNPGLSSSTAYTVEFWAKTSVASSVNAIYSENTPANWASNLLIIYYGDSNYSNGLRVWYRDSAANGGIIMTTDTNVVDGLWHHVALVQSSSSNRLLYLDGVLVASDTTIRNPLTVTNAYIGAANNNGTMSQFFNGSIDEMRLSKTARTADEIRLDASRRPYSVYTSSALDLTNVTSWNSLKWTGTGMTTGDGETATASATSSLVAQWNFNETSGTTAVSGGTCSTTCNGTLTNFIDTTSQSPTYTQQRATGGTITTNNGYIIHTFTANGTFTPSQSMKASVLVVGGGGGGSIGGGGGGGISYSSSYDIANSPYSVVVGNGGNGVWGGNGQSGGNSTFGTLTGYGGGGGGMATTNGVNGGNGGGAGNAYNSSHTGGTGSQGYNGGNTSYTSWSGGGGGGGGGGAGSNSTTVDGANGGIGYYSSITRQYYSGGGGGGSSNTNGTQYASGGAGGGGNGGTRTGGGSNGTANTGGGGGGQGTYPSAAPGNGGSGTVIVAYQMPYVSGWTADYRRWGTGALMFDGVDDYITVNDNSNLDLTSSVTLEAWIKIKDINYTNPYQDIIGKRDASVSEANYDLRVWQDELQFFYYANSSWQITTTYHANLIPGQWYHVVAANNNSSVKIYVNGQEMYTYCSMGTCNVSMVADNNKLGIGAAGDYTSTPFAGVIDSPKIYSRALTASEVLSNYNSSNIEFQTRVGDTATPDDGTWEAWRNISGETQLLNLNADAANWAWDRVSTYTPQSTSNSSFYIEGTGSLGIVAGAPLANTGTLGLWHMDETSGTGAYIHDSSGNNYHGTPNGTTLNGGFIGKGRSFNGSSDYISAGSSISLASASFTLEAWAKRNATGAAHNIMGQGSASTNNGLHLGYSSGNYLRCGFFGNDLDSPTTYTDNEWHHIACSYNATTNLRILYRDGVEIARGFSSGDFTGTGTFYIGTGYGTGGYFNGSIDEVKVSNTVRTGEYIAEEYRAGRDHRITRTISSTNLSGSSKLPFYIASDRLGTFSQVTIGESAFANYEPDTNTVALWHLDENPQEASPSSMLVYSSTNVAAANAYSYWKALSNATVVATGDTLEYDVFLNTNSTAIGGLDVKFTDSTYARSFTWTDQNGISCHPGSDLSAYAYHRWYHRVCTIPSAMNGKTISYIDIVNETDTATAIVAFYDNFVIKNSSNVLRSAIYSSGSPTYNTSDILSNASNTNSLVVTTSGPATWVLKDSAGGHDATPSAAATVYQGYMGNGLHFTSLSGESASFNSINVGTNYTIDTWLKFPLDPSSTWRTLFANDGGTYHYALIETGTNLLGIYNSTAFYPCGLDVSTINAGWHHLAIVVSSSYTYTQFYLDGLPICQSATKITSQNFGIFGSHRSWGSTQGAGTIMDEVRLSNIARSADEIRQAYEVGTRTHNITIDFKAKLGSGNLISSTADYNFTIDETAYGSYQAASHLFVSDKIIVRENVDGTVYLAQGTVSYVNASTGAVIVTAWDSGSTVPSSGFTVNATVFKWQREYFDIKGSLSSQRDAITKLTFRLTDGSMGANIWLDDISSSTGYLTNPFGSTITSSIGNRYFQYRAIFSQNDELGASSQLSSVTLDYTQNEGPNTPSLTSPSNGATNQPVYPVLKVTGTDNDSDYLQYKIYMCTDSGMTTGCETFDQTSSQTGWSGQNANGNTAYTSGSTATYTVQSLHSTNSTFYWYAYAIDPAGSNVWSSHPSAYSFTTTNSPSAPSSLLTNDQTNPAAVNLAGTIYFSALHSDPDSDTATYYQLQLNSTNVFTGSVLWDTGKTAFSTPVASGSRTSNINYTGPSLSTTTRYYWRILVYDSKGAVSSYSSVANFTTNSVPNIPTLDSPADGATGQSLYPDLKTTATDPDGDYLKYKILLCKNAAMTTGCVTFDQTVSNTYWSAIYYNSGTQASYHVPNALDPGTTYYWKSQAIDYASLNLWSATQTTPYSFRTSYVPSTPTLDSPTNGATAQSIYPVLKTTATDTDSDTLQYKILLCTNSGMTTGCQTFDQTSSSTGWSAASYASGVQAVYTVQTALTTGTTYYWKSQAIDPSGTNTWSATQASPYSFTADHSPNTVTLLTPANTSTEVTTRNTVFTFSTTDSESNYLRYKFVICPESTMTFNCTTYDQTSSQTGFSGQNTQGNTAYTSGTTATITLSSPLNPGTTYYWYAFAIDPAGSNIWSSAPTPFSFTSFSPPSAPAPCTTSKAPDNSSLTINWTDSSNEDYYRIFKITDGGFPMLLGTTYPANTIQVVDSSILVNHSYYYSIVSYREDSGWPYSASCMTSITNVRVGSFYFDGLKMEGVKLD